MLHSRVAASEEMSIQVIAEERPVMVYTLRSTVTYSRREQRRPENDWQQRTTDSKIISDGLFKVIQGNRGRYQSKACMWFPISD